MSEDLDDFLDNNPVDSVFDLEEEPTIFLEIMIDHDYVLHVDYQVDHELLQEVVQQPKERENYDCIKRAMEKLKVLARLT